LVLPFWYLPTWVVPDKGLLNGFYLLKHPVIALKLWHVHFKCSKLRRLVLLWRRIPDIYARFRQSVDKSDTAADLKWWSDNYGTSMSMAWPQFEVNTKYHAVNVTSLAGVVM